MTERKDDELTEVTGGRDWTKGVDDGGGGGGGGGRGSLTPGDGGDAGGGSQIDIEKDNPEGGDKSSNVGS